MTAIKNYIDRTTKGIEFCKEYFGFDEDDIDYMVSDQGRRKLFYLWEANQLYESKWNILRQELWQSFDPRKIRKVIPVGDGTILDVGCGVAETWRPHIESGQRVYLYETSKLVLNYLEEKYRGTSAFICDDINFLHPVDNLVCLDVLEHVRDPIGFTISLKPRLKRGGCGYFCFSRNWPHPGHLLESIDQFSLWQAVLKKKFDVLFISEEKAGYARVTH